MLYMNSINIVHGSKKKMETCTFKLNIKEYKILLWTGHWWYRCHWVVARSNSMAFVTSQLETLGMIEQLVWL